MPINITNHDEQTLREAGDTLATYAAAEARRRGLNIPPITADHDDAVACFEQAVDQLLAIAQAKPAAPAPQAKPAAQKAAAPEVIEPTLTEKALAARKGTTAKNRPVDTRSLSERCRAAR